MHVFRVLGTGAACLLAFAAVLLALAARRQVDRDVSHTLDVAARVLAAEETTHAPRPEGGPATAERDANAADLAGAVGAAVAIVSGDRVIAASLSPAATLDLTRLIAARQPLDGTAVLGGERMAFRRAHVSGNRSAYVLSTIDAHSAGATDMRTTFAVFAIGTLLLVVAGGFWLVGAMTPPIQALATSAEHLAATRDLRAQLAPTGLCRELDTFTESFNHVLLSLAVAERATETAYTGAIRALAAAVDERDPHTIGHSERVSALAVTIGQTMGLSDQEIEVLRLGALLHDIGKIGVSDAVLRKPDPLTESEQAHVRTHPVLGARILRSVPFLAPHIPIVELHHERPDGQGYPYGLRHDATPLVARIVHVADAYDAMTSTRPYRARQSDAAAMTELWRYAGSEFDAEVVEAFARSPRPLARAAVEDPTPPAAIPEPLDAALV